MRQARATLSAVRAAAVAVVACTVLVATLATLAASIGPDRVLQGDGPDRAAKQTVTPSSTATDTEPITPPQPRSRDDQETPAWVKAGEILIVCGIVAVALLGCAMLLRLLRAPRVRRRPVPREPVEFEVLMPASAVAVAIAADAEAQYEALLSGAPRNAIIECWHRFEAQAAAAGIQRERWETSSELTERVLTTIGASPGAVAGLAEVFREARFSRHEVGEELRDRAVAFLREIQGSLRRTGASS